MGPELQLPRGQPIAGGLSQVQQIRQVARRGAPGLEGLVFRHGLQKPPQRFTFHRPMGGGGNFYGQMPNKEPRYRCCNVDVNVLVIGGPWLGSVGP